MAWTLVASLIAPAAGGGAFTSSAINTTGADLIVIALAEIDGTAGVTDSKSNTYTLAVSPVGFSGFQEASLYYKATPTVGTGHTFSSSFYTTLGILAFSGAATTPLDQTNGASGGGADSVQPGSITPTENDELLVTGFVNQEHTNAAGIGGGFTIAGQQVQVDGANLGGGIAYLIQTTATAANPTWNGGAAATFWGATLASFKGGAGAPPPPDVMSLGPTQSPARLL